MPLIETLEARINKLEARVHELEDDRAIRELLGRYGFNADCCRDDEYVALYTEDGAIDLTSSGGRRWVGHKALKEFITRKYKNPGFFGRSMHVMGNNQVCHISGDTAVVNNYAITLWNDEGTLRFRSAANNQWTFKKVNGEWLIKERRRGNLGSSEYVTNLDATPR